MRHIAAWVLKAGFSTLALAAIEPGAPPALSAAQIVEKNVAARGGLEAWQKIQTMVWVGHVESNSGATTALPFLLELKRPNKTRFEVKGQGARSVRGFDGIHGWKLHLGRNGEPEVQAYSANELQFARDAGGIDGPLMDYKAKGNTVTLDGIEQVEGRKAYRLNVTLPSGASHHAWVDAETFLDIKYDRKARSFLGHSATVSVFYRNYRTIEGVQIPMTIESGGDMTKATDKMSIDKISLNPPLSDREFAKPNTPRQQRATVTIGANSEPPALPLTRSESAVPAAAFGPHPPLSLPASGPAN
jgi:hypothetical protein